MTDVAKSKPSHRVAFARIIGKDETGQDKLGSAREIGAVWPRKDASKGGILRLDHIPVELTQRQGVLFVMPIEETGDIGGVS